jgi:hypothetical protein
MASVVAKLSRPAWALRRIRELGVGRLASEFLVKRWRIAPITAVGPTMRALRVARRPSAYFARKRLAKSFVATHGNPLAIPDHQGYRVVHSAELPQHRSALALCQEVLRSRPEVLARNPDSYGLNLLAPDGLSWTKEPIDLRPHSALLDLALAPPLLAAASAYLGEIPALASVQIYATTDRHSMAGNNFYHFDKDHRMVKFWMAVTDIDDESGPFTFLPADKSRVVREKVGYHGRIPDERVYSAARPEDRVEFKGPPGSMILVDTCRCIHFGSRTRKGPRVMLLLQYQSNFAWFENAYYYQPVLFDRTRYAGNREAAMLFAQLREKAPGVRDW